MGYCTTITQCSTFLQCIGMPLLWYCPFFFVFVGKKGHFCSLWVNFWQRFKVSTKPVRNLKLKQSHTKPLFEVIKVTSGSFCKNPFTCLQRHGVEREQDYVLYNPQKLVRNHVVSGSANISGRHFQNQSSTIAPTT